MAQYTEKYKNTVLVLGEIIDDNTPHLIEIIEFQLKLSDLKSAISLF